MLTKRESEILGIMFGDGCLSKTERSFQIAITGNKFDDEIYLLKHVRPLFEDVFGIKLTTRYRHGENTMDLYRHSKEVALTLNSWGMPIGLKKSEKLIPRLSIDAIAFVRGVFDTDGSIYRKYGPYVQIQFKAVSKTLMIFLREKLTMLGLHPTRLRPDETKYRTMLCRQEEVETFFRLVKPRNPKHTERLKRMRRQIV